MKMKNKYNSRVKICTIKSINILLYDSLVGKSKEKRTVSRYNLQVTTHRDCGARAHITRKRTFLIS